MKEIIQGLIGDKADGWVRLLTAKFGFGNEQASAFVPALVERVGGLFTDGKIDLEGGLNASTLLSKLDVGALAAQAGVDREQAEQGLGALLPDLTSTIEAGAGGAEGLKNMLGDSIGGRLKSGLGGLFGR